MPSEVKKAKLRRPGRLMFDMAIKLLREKISCPPGKECEHLAHLGIVTGDQCHECWTEYFKWEELETQKPI